MDNNVVIRRGVTLHDSYQKDLEYLYDKLLHHPLFIIDTSKKIEFDALYHSLNKQATSYDKFITSVNRLTGYFCDGHTNMEIPYSVLENMRK